MHDPAANVSLQGMLNSVISESIWGSLNISIDLLSSKDLPIDSWQIVSTAPSRDPPSETLLNFGEFLETRTSLSRPERKALKTAFTEPGNIGERFRGYFDQLLGAMSPVDQQASHFILPAFYRLLTTLNERGIDYRIIFRTFGHDALEVAHDYNAFCADEHHSLPNPWDMSQRTLLPTCFGRLTRTSASAVSLEALSPHLPSSPSSGAQAAFPTVVGVKNIYKFIYETLLRSSHAFSIQDDFSYWDASGERFVRLLILDSVMRSDDSGKLLLIDRRDEDREITQVAACPSCPSFSYSSSRSSSTTTSRETELTSLTSATFPNTKTEPPSPSPSPMEGSSAASHRSRSFQTNCIS
jgi:hypothetical protein